MNWYQVVPTDCVERGVSGLFVVGSLHIGENVATKTDCRNAVINAYGCIQRDELRDADSFLSDAFKWINGHVHGATPFDSEPHQIVRRLRDWWIVRQLNPMRWFKRAERPVDLSEVEEPKRRITVKKLIGLVAISGIVGAGSSYISSDFGGPTQLERGQFTSIQQCVGCETIRTEGNVCTQCGETQATEKIAAPLMWRPFRANYSKGWQFKDGSTELPNGEWIVPELVVTKTMRM